MLRKISLIVSIIILIIGIYFISYDYFNYKKIEIYDYMNKLVYDNNVNENHIEEEVSNQEDGEVSVEENYSLKEEKIEYIGYLSIPKIDLYKGFSSKSSKYNNVNKNLYLLDESDYPDKVNGNVIIAGHSGNGSVSFFKNLYKLELDDNIYITYDNREYVYKIIKIYDVNKTGKIEILSKDNSTLLTLITCTKGSNTLQTVYVSELINFE